VDSSLDAVVSAFEPRAQCVPVTTAADEARAFRVTIDREQPAAEAPELAIAKISTGAAFRFRVPTAPR
jgi:hypothetical protein